MIKETKSHAHHGNTFQTRCAHGPIVIPNGNFFFNLLQTDHWQTIRKGRARHTSGVFGSATVSNGATVVSTRAADSTHSASFWYQNRHNIFLPLSFSRLYHKTCHYEIKQINRVHVYLLWRKWESRWSCRGAASKNRSPHCSHLNGNS